MSTVAITACVPFPWLSLQFFNALGIVSPALTWSFLELVLVLFDLIVAFLDEVVIVEAKADPGDSSRPPSESTTIPYLYSSNSSSSTSSRGKFASPAAYVSFAVSSSSANASNVLRFSS